MTYISIDYSYCFLVGRICTLMEAHFLWPLLKRKAFLLRLNKGSNFLQSAFWIWITKRFSLVRECNVFLQCCIPLGPAHQFSLQNVKLSRIVTYRSKIIRVNCSLNWSYINVLWRIELNWIVLHTNLISCRVGFVLSCFCKSNFSCTLLWPERYSRSVYWALNLDINTHVAHRNSCFPIGYWT